MISVFRVRPAASAGCRTQKKCLNDGISPNHKAISSRKFYHRSQLNNFILTICSRTC